MSQLCVRILVSHIVNRETKLAFNLEVQPGNDYFYDRFQFGEVKVGTEEQRDGFGLVNYETAEKVAKFGVDTQDAWDSDGNSTIVKYEVVNRNSAVTEHFELQERLADERYEESLAEAHEYITATDDGPVTGFVMIARAIELARNNRFPRVEFALRSADPVANALSAALQANDYDN